MFVSINVLRGDQHAQKTKVNTYCIAILYWNKTDTDRAQLVCSLNTTQGQSNSRIIVCLVIRIKMANQLMVHTVVKPFIIILSQGIVNVCNLVLSSEPVFALGVFIRPESRLKTRPLTKTQFHKVCKRRKVIYI